MRTFPDAQLTCEELLREIGHTNPPTDLVAVAALWPDLRVSEQDLEKEGYLIYLGAHGGELVIRSADPHTRKRFTFAHELGHWVLADRSNVKNEFGQLGCLMANGRNTREEMWCNEFAANLLMPCDNIQDYLVCDDMNIARKLTSGHNLFDVSEQAFLKRVADVKDWVILQLILGAYVHRVGFRYFRRGRSRDFVDHLVTELLEMTQGFERLTNNQIEMREHSAYAVLKFLGRDIATYIVCLVPRGS